MSWLYLADIYISLRDWENALFYLEQTKRFFTGRSDISGILAVLDYERGIYARQGNMRKAMDIEQEMWSIFASAGELSYLRTRIAPSWEMIWEGRYAEREQEYRKALEVARSSQDQENVYRRTCDLAHYLGLQGKHIEALAAAEEGLSLARSFGNAGELEVFAALVSYGNTCLKCGKLDDAEKYLSEAIAVGQKLHAHYEIAPLYLAAVYEIEKRYEKAEYFYQLSQTIAHQLGRNYFESGTLTGIVRVKYAQNNGAAVLPFWTEAEKLAQLYEYNDHLASLYLTRGHITWDGTIPEWGNGFDSALRCYQLALIHALRFNRFLLDETLAGRKDGTPLRPIILHFLELGKEGQQMLIALRDWWKNGMNNIGKPRSDSISPLPEDIPLLQAEQIARQREPGDGLPQTSVVEQINRALQ
jgi:tetratricopeptide (TPR) repeat protein